jgi:DNA-binding MarR family transcriptional regulator
MSASAVDLESRVVDADHQALKLWLRLLACTTRIENTVRQRLRSEFGTTLPRFDCLAQLARTEQGLTMGELSARLMVTGGNVTGIVDQLEAEGLAVRTAHPEDRRAVAVRLTPQGARLFRRMAATHERWIVELLAGWSPAEQAALQSLLGGLKRSWSLPTQPARRPHPELDPPSEAGPAVQPVSDRTARRPRARKAVTA